MRKVFLDDLTHKGSRIDWRNSIGCKIKFIYDDIQGELTIFNYDKDACKIYLSYLDIEKILPILIADLKKCRLSRLLGKTTRSFKIKIGTQIKDNKRDLTIIDREYRIRKHKNNSIIHDKYYKYKCNKCGYDEGWILESSLLNQKTGCSCCRGMTVIENINSIVSKKEDQWMIPYFQGGYDEAKLYTKGSNHKIYPICPNCGRVKKKKISISDIYHDKSIGCSCGDGMSYPNKFMFNILEQLHIKFINEYNPNWIKPKRYDFYFEVNNKKYIVEMDGGWHTQNNNMSGQTKEKSQYIDNYKDKLAKEHNIKTIRIDCFESELEYIKKNILKSKLNNIFNLSNIDWLKVEEFALSNLVKQACNLKKDNPNMTTENIGDKMNLNRGTIIKYLKQGVNLGWCNYNPKEEFKKAQKIKRYNEKRIEIFKEGISLGIFKSCSELSRQAKKLFNVKLSTGDISAVCKGTRNTHHGFTFKYVEQDDNITN